MPEINVFNEGLSRRVDAQYLQTTQGRTVHNINLDKGTLNSRPEDTLAGFGDRGLLPFWWRNRLFSNSEDAIFVEFDRRMYKNTNGFIQVSDYWPQVDPIEWSPVGLEAPDGTIGLELVRWTEGMSEVENECGTLTSPVAPTEFIMMVNDVAHYVEWSFKSHNEPFFLEFPVPAGSEHTLYRNKGADNYTYIGASDDGTPIRYGCDIGIGESVTGVYQAGEIEIDDVVRVDDEDSLGVTVGEVSSDGETLTVHYEVANISGIQITQNPLETFGIEVPLTAGRWIVYKTFVAVYDDADNKFMIRVLIEGNWIDIDLNPPTKGVKQTGKGRILPIGANFGEDFLNLVADKKIYTFYKDEIEITSTDLDDMTIEYEPNNLNLNVQSGEYIADYWMYEDDLYGLISSGNDNRLYHRVCNEWTKVLDVTGQYWGASTANNVNEHGIYMTFRESIKIWNGSKINFDKPQLRVPSPYLIDPREISYSLRGDKLSALSKAKSAVIPDKTFMFDINMDLELDATTFSDLDRSNMLYGAYTYTMAYENSDGSQSDILASSSTLYVPTGHVRVTIPQAIIDNTPVDGELILFRTFGVGGQYYEVTRWEKGDEVTEYLDTTHDADLGLPPDNVGGNPPPEGIYLLTEHRGRLYGAVDNRLYFSEYGDVHNWPAINYLVMPQDISGIASITTGLIIFAQNSTTILLGSDIEDYQVRPVDKLIGCMNYRTIQPAKGGVFFMAWDGIYFCGGADVKNVSEEALGNLAKTDSRLTLADITSSVFVADEYIISMDDYFFSMDLARGMKFSTFSDNSFDQTGYASITTNGGIVYGHKGGVTYALGTSHNPSLLEFKSGDMTEGVVTNLKEYDKLRVVFKGTFTIVVWLEDGTAIIKEIDSKEKTLQMIGFNNNKNRGTSLTYSVVGRGIIYAIDFVIKARSNKP